MADEAGQAKALLHLHGQRLARHSFQTQRAAAVITSTSFVSFLRSTTELGPFCSSEITAGKEGSTLAEW